MLCNAMIILRAPLVFGNKVLKRVVIAWFVLLLVAMVTTGCVSTVLSWLGENKHGWK